MDFDANFGLEACYKSHEKSMDFEMKNPKNREQINSKSVIFFECVF